MVCKSKWPTPNLMKITADHNTVLQNGAQASYPRQDGFQITYILLLQLINVKKYQH